MAVVRRNRIIEDRIKEFSLYYDERDQVFYFIGVLDEHIGRNLAVYHKVKEMIEWIKKHLGGEFYGLSHSL